MIRTLVGVIAVAVYAAAWAAPQSSEASTFNPFFGPTAFYSLSNTAVSANPDITAQFNVLAPSANFSGLFGRVITFGSQVVTNASAAQIPGVGAYMGQLQSTATLGLANEGCNTPVGVTFNFVEANVDTTALPIDTPPGDGNLLTSNDPLLVNMAGGTGTGTTIVYDGASGTDPLGRRTDGLPINIIQIDSEKMLLNNTPPLPNSHGGTGGGTNPAKTYTVTRGWEGTSIVAHADNAEIKRVNIIFPSGPSDNLLANMAEDDGNMDNQGSVENADYVNNVSDGADSGAPSFVRDSFDPDGNPANGGYVQPLARYYAVAFVANSLIVTLQFAIGAPGSLTTFPNLQWATNAWGYSSTTFLQDPLAPPSNSAISDFCNFTSNTVLYGVPHDNACTGPATPPGGCTGTGNGFTLRLAVDGGCPSAAPLAPNECGLAGQTNGICAAVTCPRATNPAIAQSVHYYQYAVSQRDYDNDGHDNALDACFNVANAGWDPRQSNSLSGGDSEFPSGDGLPDACDPAPAAFNNDQDGDGWQNRLDNCPLVANAAPGGGGGTVANTFQFDLDVPGGTNVPDGGPASDSIGAACDIAGNSCSGCPALTPTGANGHYHAAFAAQTICIGAVTSDCSTTLDADGDGVVNARDTCINGANPPQTFAGPSGQDLTSANAGAGATTISVGSTTGFIERQPIVIGLPNDGHGNRETLRYIATGGITPTTLTITQGLSVAHTSGTNVAMVMFAQAEGDLDADGFGTILDVSLAAAAFPSAGGDPNGAPGYEGRLDLDYDSLVDIADVSLTAELFGSTC